MVSMACAESWAKQSPSMSCPTSFVTETCWDPIALRLVSPLKGAAICRFIEQYMGGCHRMRSSYQGKNRESPIEFKFHARRPLDRSNGGRIQSFR
jgi:hypothetical protein